MLDYPHMALTAQQKAKIKKIIHAYDRDVRKIVAKHKQVVIKAVEDLDKRKAEKIKQLIQQS